MVFKRKMHLVETPFYNVLSICVLLLMEIQTVNPSEAYKLLALGEGHEFKLRTNNGDSTVTVNYVVMLNYHNIFNSYDFFVPSVNVVCQCQCTDRQMHPYCSRDEECGRLMNSTTTCTIYNQCEKNSNVCPNYYKLCCQTYFSKTEMLKPFKALHLKYVSSLFMLTITSNGIKKYDVIVTENTKQLLVGPDMMLQFQTFHPRSHLPNAWYYVEEESTELKHSDLMNTIDELNMTKIGWFQYNDKEKELSRVTREELKKHLQVDLLDCQSNPSRYSWKLNASYYIKERSVQLPSNTKKVAKIYRNGIFSQSENFKFESIKVIAENQPSVYVTVSSVNVSPFIFTCVITERLLNLKFIKGNGTFDVIIKSPHWTDEIKFLVTSAESKMELPFSDFDQSWVCVEQNGQQVCQMASLAKKHDQSITPTDMESLQNASSVEMKHNETIQNRNNSEKYSTNSISQGNLTVIIIVILVVLGSLIVIVIFIRRRPRNVKTRKGSGDEIEMEPLSSDSRSQGYFSNIRKYFRFRRLTELQQQIEEIQRKAYEKVELPQASWMNRILPLEELYVELEMFNTNNEDSERKSMNLEDLFEKIDGNDPKRILVEGDPGYGKSTLCLKLLNDWARNRGYIRQKFKMVFKFALRYFKENESIVEMLKSELEVIDINGKEGIKCIKMFAAETLLILDGIDEMNETCRQKLFLMLQNNEFLAMYVVVTSRRGMINVENTREQKHGGYLGKYKKDDKIKHYWNKRVVIKGVKQNETQTFIRKYLDKDFHKLHVNIDSIMQGEMREVLQCPLFLILVVMMLEENASVNVNSKTTLYIEFFNFMIKRNLVREKKLSKQEEVDILNHSNENIWFELLVKFGEMAVEFLCQNKVMFDEKDISNHFSEEIILLLGFLTKIPKMHLRKKEIVYQPIHKSFLEFVAAFAMWNLFQNDENKFIKEIVQIGDKGLKPTNDSLFYVFLGGLMNSKAYVLFQSLTRYSLWFNIESLCFTNILLEIKDIPSFFPSFETMLDPFIPFFYNIITSKGVSSEFFQSEIHSLILNHASDRQLINVLWWNSNISITLSHELNMERLHIHLKDEIIKIWSHENKHLINCKNVYYQFTQFFKLKEWDNFVSLFNSINCENINFAISSGSTDSINSLVISLLHKELTEGQWKQKNIHLFRFEVNESDDPSSLSLLVELVKKNRIDTGIHLKLNESNRRIEEKNTMLKRKVEELFNAIIKSKTIKQFFVYNSENICFEFDFTPIINSHLKSFYFMGDFNLSITNRNSDKYTFEDMRVLESDVQKPFGFIQNIQVSNYLDCELNCFNLLVQMESPSLKKISELAISEIGPKSLDLLKSLSQLTNLEVFAWDVSNIKSKSADFKRDSISVFSQLNLRVIEFLYIQNVEQLSFFTEVIMEGLNKKEQYENNSTTELKDGRRYQLQELVFKFDEIEMKFDQSKEPEVIQWIKSMLRQKQLQQCCWVDYYNILKLYELEHFFPSKDKFKIFYEIDGMNPNNSRRTRLVYSWFLLFDRYCIKYIENE